MGYFVAGSNQDVSKIVSLCKNGGIYMKLIGVGRGGGQGGGGGGEAPPL